MNIKHRVRNWTKFINQVFFESSVRRRTIKFISKLFYAIMIGDNNHLNAFTLHWYIVTLSIVFDMNMLCLVSV